MTTTAPTRLPLATVQFRLLTPVAAVEAFRLVGVTWNPTPVPVEKAGGDDGYKPKFSDENPPISTDGLYAWSAPTDRSSPDSDLMSGGIIYWGVGVKLDGRLEDELKWAADAYVHGHGMAAHRTGALPVRGKVRHEITFDKRWVRPVVRRFGGGDEQYERYMKHLDQFVRDLGDAETRLATIEKFGVRLSMHVGDVGAPVQSQHAGAWYRDVKKTGDGQLAVADRVALLVAEHFRHARDSE